jgi:hypothetical protein
VPKNIEMKLQMLNVFIFRFLSVLVQYYHRFWGTHETS